MDIWSKMKCEHFNESTEEHGEHSDTEDEDNEDGA